MSLFLSRLVLDPRSPQTQSELIRPYELHRTIAHAFADLAAARVLFRAEPGGSGLPQVIVQSREAPNWDAVRSRASHISSAESKPLTLSGLSAGQSLRFRLLCRPTKRISIPAAEGIEKREIGPRVVLTTPEDLFAWLARQGERGGFRADEATFDRVYWLDSRSEVRAQKAGVRRDRTPLPPRMKKTDEPLLGAVRFDGVLTVQDPAALAEAVRSGIGPQKAFGFGLLSLGR